MMKSAGIPGPRTAYEVEAALKRNEVTGSGLDRNARREYLTHPQRSHNRQPRGGERPRLDEIDIRCRVDYPVRAAREPINASYVIAVGPPWLAFGAIPG
jgi:hypothetical protein